MFKKENSEELIKLKRNLTVYEEHLNELMSRNENLSTEMEELKMKKLKITEEFDSLKKSANFEKKNLKSENITIRKDLVQIKIDLENAENKLEISLNKNKELFQREQTLKEENSKLNCDFINFSTIKE